MTTGRPRDRSLDDHVLDAALEIMSVRGYSGLRIDDLVTATGVAKTTMYRRWPSLVHLAVAAVEKALGERLPQRTGVISDDLAALIDRSFGALASAGGEVMLIGLDIARQDDPQLRALYRERVIEPVRVAAREILADGLARGQLRADVEPEVLTDALIGGLIYRFAFLHEEPRPAAAREFVLSLFATIEQPHTADPR